METQFSSDEINIAISSSILEEQIHFIEKLEDCLEKKIHLKNSLFA